MPTFLTGPIIIIAVVILALVILFRFVPMGLWISALAANVHVGIFTLIGMRLRRVVPARIVNPLIKAVKAGIKIPINKLEAHYLAGGNVDRVVNSLIAAQRADIPLEFERACAIDLAGRDVLEAVQMSVNPKVIETPVVAAIAKDGIELKAKAKVTVRANIDRLVGGAGEQTIIARVGEGVVTTIGSAEDHKSVLENPDMISKTVLNKGLEAGTAFEILSIDIADIDVGRNIGAQLQTDQAEADKKIAQAKAEERRAMANAGQGGGGRGRGAYGHGPGPAGRQAGGHGLLQPAERDLRHPDAGGHRRRGEEVRRNDHGRSGYGKSAGASAPPGRKRARRPHPPEGGQAEHALRRGLGGDPGETQGSEEQKIIDRGRRKSAAPIVSTLCRHNGAAKSENTFSDFAKMLI